MSANKVKVCPKCKEEMAKIGEEHFGKMFGCTREPKNLEVLKGEIQTYLCKACGYIEFYKE